MTKLTEELGKTAGKDLVTDKIMYPKLMGIKKSREFAEKLKKDTRKQLSRINPNNATSLVGLVDFIFTSQTSLMGPMLKYKI